MTRTVEVTPHETSVRLMPISRTVDVTTIDVETMYVWFGPRQMIEGVREASGRHVHD